MIDLRGVALKDALRFAKEERVLSAEVHKLDALNVIEFFKKRRVHIILAIGDRKKPALLVTRKTRHKGRVL